MTIIAGVTLSLGQVLLIIGTTILFAGYLFDRNFREAVNSLITLIFQKAVDGVGYLIDVIKEIVRSAKNGKKYCGSEKHHIVAQTDFRAYQTRYLIKRYGIKTSDSVNIVSVKKTMHKHLHTNACFSAVDLFLRFCAAGKITWIERRYALITGIMFIGIMLKAASSIC